VLPSDIPPSYKGQDIKLTYKVCIGIGRIGKPLSLIKIPFRVIEMKGQHSRYCYFSPFFYICRNM